MADEARVSSDELAEHPGRFLMCAPGSYGVTKLLDKIGPEHIVLVWSMWRGYWERDGALGQWAEHNHVEAQFVHSGDHAWPQDLERLVAAIAPRELIWVHTDALLTAPVPSPAIEGRRP